MRFNKNLYKHVLTGDSRLSPRELSLKKDLKEQEDRWAEENWFNL
jgi:hypothetical protein